MTTRYYIEATRGETLNRFYCAAHEIEALRADLLRRGYRDPVAYRSTPLPPPTSAQGGPA